MGNLLSKAKFRAFSIAMFERPRTVEELEKEGIASRGTVYRYLKMFRIVEDVSGTKVERYDSEYIKMEGKHLRRNLYYFTQRILIDWICEKVELSDDNIEALKRILLVPEIDMLLRRGNRNWDDVITKVIFVLMVFKLWNLKLEFKKVAPFLLSEIPNLELLNYFTEEEIDRITLALQEIAKAEKHMASDLALKIINASIPIVFTSKDYDKILPDVATWYAECVDKSMKGVCQLFKKDRRSQMIPQISKVFSNAFVKKPPEKKTTSETRPH